MEHEHDCKFDLMCPSLLLFWGFLISMGASIFCLCIYFTVCVYKCCGRLKFNSSDWSTFWFKASDWLGLQSGSGDDFGLIYGFWFNVSWFFRLMVIV